MNSKDPVYSAYEEPVPVKFYFYRRQHAAEFVAELHRLEVFDTKVIQTFTGKERWMVVTDPETLWYGPGLADWFRKAKERWAPSEGKLGAEAKT